MNASDRLRRLVPPAVLWIGAAAAAFAAPLDPTPEVVLDRAIAATSGTSAQETVKEIRVVWIGTQDLWAVYQKQTTVPESLGRFVQILKERMSTARD